MARASRKAAEIGFAALSVEGGLISPDQIQAIASATPDQKLAGEYGCPKGAGLRDEITRYFRIAQAYWRDWSRIDHPTSAQTATFVRDLLEQAFGFELTGPHVHMRDGRRFTIAWEAREGRVPIVVAPPLSEETGRGGDGFSRALPEFGDGPEGRIQRRSPGLLLQDWLNANPDFYWGLVFAGDRLRLMRDNASLTRPAWIEADLGAILRDDMFADFTALWLLIHASRFGEAGAAPGDCALERWREAGLQAGASARDRLRDNVEDALLALGKGLIESNADLRRKLDENALTLPGLFEQMLRLVYRLIFLAVAEDRDLLHPPGTPRSVRNLYAGNYGFGFLRDRSARRSSHDHHADAWEGMKVVFRSLAEGEKALGLPALGGLFDPALTTDINTSVLPNRALYAAVYRLAWLIEDGRRVRINWRDMATEELGSVYEGLLELVPLRSEAGRSFTFAGGEETRGNARKVSGSYYTPDSLVQCLLDSAFDPVLDRAEAEDGVDAILDLRVIDPACGSGHFLLGAARRMATRIAQLRNPDAPDYPAALRDVVRNCIHGVDRNPMAVELARVALWIESVEPGKPLGFLDASLQCGDSLLGVFDLKALDAGIPDDAFKPLTGDDPAIARLLRDRNRSEKSGQGHLDFVGGGGVMPPARMSATFEGLRRLPEDTVSQVAEKRRRFARWEKDPARQATQDACDFYVAAFLLPKVSTAGAGPEALDVPTTADLRRRLGGGEVDARLTRAALQAAGSARAFHWPLAFPEVMIGRGGFDVVIGNPPWEVVQLSEEEYFASRLPEISELKGATRKRAIADLETTSPEVFARYLADKRDFDAMNEFARGAGRFNLTARGKLNTYGLFAEHFLNLANVRGCAGMIVPTGIATDATTAPFFGHLVSSQRLAGLFDFENREKLFAAVDSRMKFALLTLGSGVPEAEFAFFLTDPTQLEDSRRRFTLSPAQIAAINPNTKTAPVFRSRRDAELTAQIYSRVPVLIDEERGSAGNPWGMEFRQGLFNMTSDSGLFRTAKQLRDGGWVRDGADWVKGAQRMVPLYEAKMIHQFDHRWATYDGSDSRDAEIAEKQDAGFESHLRYWVPQSEVADRLSAKNWEKGWLLGWRDICRATDERTVISSFFPRSGVGHTMPLFFSTSEIRLWTALQANLCSMTLDFVARQSIGGTHLTYGYLKQFPIISPSAYSESSLAFIVPRVLELSYTSHSMTPFARDLGYDGPPFAWDEDRRAQLRAELDAWYALAYGLTRDELRYVLDPRDVMGADYPSETFRVLQKNEIARYGEYRTRRLVLAAYDNLVAQGLRPRAEGYR